MCIRDRYVDVTLTRSKVKVKVTGLLNFRQLAKTCMLAAMSAAPLRGFLVQDGGRHHLGFFKFKIFNGRTAEDGRTASPCQIWSKSVNWRPRYGDFSIFQDGDAAILDFSNFKFLTVGQLKRAEMRRSVKFGQNRSKRGRDMAIFRFSKMAAAAIFDF